MRITIKKMRQYEAENIEDDACIVRWLEMNLDAIIWDHQINQGIGLQFWKDVDLYGLKEAYIFLRNSIPETVSLDDFKRKVDDTISLLENYPLHLEDKMALVTDNFISFQHDTNKECWFWVDNQEVNKEMAIHGPFYTFQGSLNSAVTFCIQKHPKEPND